MNQITGQWPDLSCQKTDQGCQISQALGFLCCYPGTFDGRAINGVSFLNRVGAVFYLFYGIFSTLNTVSGTPFLGWFFTLLLFIVAVEGFKVFRSGHTA